MNVLTPKNIRWEGGDTCYFHNQILSYSHKTRAGGALEVQAVGKTRGNGTGYPPLEKPNGGYPVPFSTAWTSNRVPEGPNPDIRKHVY